MPSTIVNRAAAAVVRAGLALSLALGLGLACAAASPAHAEWKRAESERFIVYSDGDEAVLRAYVRKLETFDRTLRIYMNLPVEEAPPRKLPIYLVANHAELQRVWPGVPETLVGFYAGSDQDIFAVAQRSRGDDGTLLHEYGHHFMLQHFPFPYPSWFVEGFAEYFANAEIRSDRVRVGLTDRNSASWLAYGQGWVPMRDILTQSYFQVREHRETYYPISWLMTHWFYSDPARKRQLNDYLNRLGRGEESVAAMQAATGLSPEQLEQALKAYLRGRVLIQEVVHDFPEPQVAITTLSPAADELLLLNQRLTRGVAEDQREAVLAQARAGVARWPDEPLSSIVMGRALLIAERPLEADQAVAALLNRDPDNVVALQVAAQARLAQATAASDPDEATRLEGQARALLGRAYRADGSNYTTLELLAEARRSVPGYPNDNDIQTLRLAYELAPQLAGVRFNLAAALVATGRGREGALLLAPLFNDPHDPDVARAARQLAAEALSGEGGSIIDQAAAAGQDAQDDPPEAPETSGDD